MKKFLSHKIILTAAFCCAATFANADMVIVQQIDSNNGKPREMTIKIKGTKARIDISAAQSLIVDTATGDTTTLLNEQKMVLKMSGATMKTIAEKTKQMQNSGATDQPPKLVDTGAKEKIDGYDAEIYTCAIGNMKIKYWIAKDYPNYQAIMEQIKKLQSNSLSSFVKWKQPDFPGMVMKTTVDVSVTMAGHQLDRVITTKLVSAKEQPVADSEFAVPADFTEMPMPSMPTAPTAPPAAK